MMQGEEELDYEEEPKDQQDLLLYVSNVPLNFRKSSIEVVGVEKWCFIGQLSLPQPT